MTAITLNLRPTLTLTDEQFEQICRANRDLKFERTAQGELVVMALTGGDTGRRNLRFTGQIWLWNQQTGLGEGFDSSTGFRLPNGAIRSPDAAWVRLDRWQALTPEQWKKFVPLCPDFLVELRSLSDELEDIQAKMQEYLAHGLLLGWLIDPQRQMVEIYRPNQAVESLNQPTTLSGESILPEFVLDLTGILSD
ncbi:MAG: Uma2 family endonuclease [Coleofasciculus sp. C1-SOL-03]|jgi:Uma2 family endonuclease|uniref:Uma2 family endonuclease n=1 Tax=Coleofasciculus sp. C1-SOL-03 TaxID=3069522 RepID=UPI00330245E5